MESQGPVCIGVLTAEFFIPGSHSLKQKPMVLNALRDRAHNEFNVALAETGYHDKWQRSQWTFCFVGSDRACLEGAIGKFVEFLSSGRHAQMTHHQIEFV